MPGNQPSPNLTLVPSKTVRARPLIVYSSTLDPFSIDSLFLYFSLSPLPVLPLCPNFCRSFKKEQHPQGLVRDGYSPDQETAEGGWPVEAVQSRGLLAQALGLSLKKESLVQKFLFKPSCPLTWSPLKAFPVRPVTPLSHCHGEPQGLPTVGSQPRLISGVERSARCPPLSHIPMRPAYISMPPRQSPEPTALEPLAF